MFFNVKTKLFLRQMFKKLLSLFLVSISFSVYSQTYTLKAIITDEVTKEALPAANVLIKSLTDSTLIYTTLTNAEGVAFFKHVKSAPYVITVKYIGYQAYTNRFYLKENTDLGFIGLKTQSTNLKEAKIEGTAIRAEQLKDTIQYNADAYKVNRDATAEDLIKKMPGVTIENGTVKAGGEEVKKVLVDGKEFFGDDPSLALRNLPAEIIDKMQVFDRMSEQSQFTKFDDGNSQKTINLTSKKGKANGVFGKIYGGIGTENTYQGGASLNIFNGNRRLTFLGISNNINQQNFGMQDILGISGASGRMRGGMGSSMMRSGNTQAMRYMGGSEMANFMVGQQNGIASTNAVGMNYSDIWFKKINVQGSYFFNQSNTANNGSVNRTYFLNQLNGQVYNETNESKTDNYNHRFNLRFQYDLDSNNKFIYTPKFNYQDNAYFSLTNGSTTANLNTINSTNNKNNSVSKGYNFSNNLMWQHRFAKAGRTISTAIQADYNDKNGSNTLQSTNIFYNNDTVTSIDNIDQISNSNTDGYTYGLKLSYTEPVGKFGMVQIEYNPNTTYNNTDKITYSKPNGSEEYTNIDTILSNNFNNTYNRHRGGVSYQFNNDKYNISIGTDYQYATLIGDQLFPTAFALNRPFQNILPNASFNYRPNKEKNFKVIYRTNTNIPSIQQLQEVVDNSNTIQLSTGNSKLVQSFNHTFITRYGLTKTGGEKTLFVVSYNNLTQNSIANQTIIAGRDTVLDNGITLKRGTQLTRPVNLDGNVSSRVFLNYGFPVKLIKSNINVSLGYTYNRAPGLINTLENVANTHGINGGLVVGSNISEKIDFTVSYNNSFNIVKNNLQPQLDNTYYNQNISGKANFLIKKVIVFNTDITHYVFTGLSQSFNQQFLLVNAAVGYKFLKNKQGELKLSVFDLLNQNNSVSRNVTETYIEDQRNLVLRQYFMLTFTYNLRYFKM